MGDFISRGIAIGFAFGVSAALIARRHPLLRKHPNLLGFAVAGTADAISRDYRRPVIYDRLLRLDTPLASRAKSFLYSLRTGSEEEPTEISNARPFPWGKPDHGDRIVSTEPQKTEHAPVPPAVIDWWSPEPEEVKQLEKPAPAANQYGAVKLPSGGPFKGTRTWDDIRRRQDGEDGQE